MIENPTRFNLVVGPDVLRAQKAMLSVTETFSGHRPYFGSQEALECVSEAIKCFIAEHMVEHSMPASALSHLAWGIAQNPGSVQFATFLAGMCHPSLHSELVAFVDSLCKRFDVQILWLTHSLDLIEAAVAHFSTEPDSLAVYSFSAGNTRRYDCATMECLIDAIGFDVRYV